MAPGEARAIWRLLCSGDLERARQGLELLEILDRPALVRELARGVWIDEEGEIRRDARAAQRTWLRTPSWEPIALELLRLSGGMAEVKALRLRPHRGLSELSALRSAGALESLWIHSSRGAALELEGLPPLPGLKRLWIDRAPWMRRLDPLSRLIGLESLEIGGAPQPVDLSPLAGLPLRELSLRAAAPRASLAPLGDLTALRSLWLSGSEASDLKPLARLASLESLRLHDVRPDSAAPIGAMSALKRLDLHPSPNRAAPAPLDLTPLGALSLTHLSLHYEPTMRGLRALLSIPTLEEVALRGPRSVLPVRGTWSGPEAIGQLRDALGGSPR